MKVLHFWCISYYIEADHNASGPGPAKALVYIGSNKLNRTKFLYNKWASVLEPDLKRTKAQFRVTRVTDLCASSMDVCKVGIPSPKPTKHMLRAHLWPLHRCYFNHAMAFFAWWKHRAMCMASHAKGSPSRGGNCDMPACAIASLLTSWWSTPNFYRLAGIWGHSTFHGLCSKFKRWLKHSAISVHTGTTCTSIVFKPNFLQSWFVLKKRKRSFDFWITVNIIMFVNSASRVFCLRDNPFPAFHLQWKWAHSPTLQVGFSNDKIGISVPSSEHLMLQIKKHVHLEERFPVQFTHEDNERIT